MNRHEYMIKSIDLTKEQLDALCSLYELLKCSFADEGFQVYNHNNQKLASLSKEETEIVEDVIEELLENV